MDMKSAISSIHVSTFVNWLMSNGMPYMWSDANLTVDIGNGQFVNVPYDDIVTVCADIIATTDHSKPYKAFMRLLVQSAAKGAKNVGQLKTDVENTSSHDELIAAAKDVQTSMRLTSYPLKFRFAEANGMTKDSGLATLDAVHEWMKGVYKRFDAAIANNEG